MMVQRPDFNRLETGETPYYGLLAVSTRVGSIREGFGMSYPLVPATVGPGAQTKRLWTVTLTRGLVKQGNNICLKVRM